MAKILVSAGAPIDQRNLNDETPVRLAVRNNMFDILW